MKQQKYLLTCVCLVAILFTASCKKSLNDLYQNPNAFTSTNIELLFPQGIVNSVPTDYADAYNRIVPKLAPMMQLTANHVAEPAVLNLYRFNSAASAGSGGAIDFGRWANYYNGKMPILKEIEKIYTWTLTEQEKEGYKVYFQLAKIIAAFNTSVTTDLFGDMPYSEAFTARNSIYNQSVNLTPKFDTQQEIYYTILTDLKEASGYLDTAQLYPSVYNVHSLLQAQDVLFKGDLAKWEKLANSLRLRMAMRISGADNARAAEEISDIVNNNRPLILDIGDNAVLYNEALSSEYLFRGVREYSPRGTFAPELMVNTMNESNDPRKKIFFYTDTANHGTYTGMPVEYQARNTSNLTYRGSYAYLNPLFYGYNYAMPVGFIIDAPSVHFLLAEAAKKGMIGGGDAKAKQYYMDGIAKSVLQFYKYYSTVPATQNTGSGSSAYTFTKDASLATAPSEANLAAWIDTSQYAYNPTKAIAQIALQKWMHTNILQIDETYAEFRRLKLPELKPDIYDGEQLNKVYPIRVPYPTGTPEEITNKTNYDSAVRLTDGNDYRFPVWWNK
ncbi:MAG: SusD/RagB family nutrient-binding outer membrane lipoprotein [Agriterribacter sp.]